MSGKKISATVFVFALVVCVSIVSCWAFAAGPLKNQATMSAKTAISKSGTTATVTASVRANSSVTKITTKMELQKKGGSSYSTVKTWSSTVNSSSASLKKTAVVSKSSTYRVKTTFTVYTGTTSETIVKIAT